MPKGHYVPVFRLIGRDRGFEGSKQEQDADRSKSITDGSRRRLNFTVIGLMVAAILYLVVDNYVIEQAPLVPAEEINDKSIAVLPFVPLSSGEDDGYFADGLTEEILNSLAQLPELQVTARTSSFFFKGQNLLVPEIASRLGVAHVVEGSVRRDGDRLRIAAQLIRASDDFHLWSQTYDRTRDDVFAVQEDIAENIAEVLGVVLDDAAREVMHSAGIHDVEAFIAYQKGQEAFANAHQGMNMSDALAIANAHFDRALEAAPNVTTARLMKADLRGHIIFEIAAGIRDENYPGELQETLAALREEYGLAVELSSAGNQRDLLDLERTLFGEEWTGLAFPNREGHAARRVPANELDRASCLFRLGRPSRHEVTRGGYVQSNGHQRQFQLAWSLIWSGDPDAALRAIAEADNKGLSHASLDDGRYWALLASGRVDDQTCAAQGQKEAG